MVSHTAKHGPSATLKLTRFHGPTEQGAEHPRSPSEPTRLVCANCGLRAPSDAKGWKAFHGLDEPDDQSETFVFCPECAEQGFGNPGCG